MGKDLKGKELGVGIAQRKDGLYTGRYTDSRGVRRQKYFKKLQECRKWIADMQFEKEHGSLENLKDMCFDAWFDYWITDLKGSSIRDKTKSDYKGIYTEHIKGFIGNMLLQDIKPLHCQHILNNMSEKYRISTIKATRNLLHNILQGAVDNDILLYNPVKKNIKTEGIEIKDKRVLTKQEQKYFLECMKKYSYYNQFAFLLQTGLRIGELRGLRWKDINFEERTMYIQRTMNHGSYNVGKPKSKAGNRIVPLTQEAINILNNQREKNKLIKVIPMEFTEYVFLSKVGHPLPDSSYYTVLINLCNKYNIKMFSMHSLRHTFATRCIESGMKPKTLQSILGHSNINMTMNLYVHSTEENKINEIKQIEEALKVI